MGYTGRCNCGAVSAVLSGEPIAVRRCWCRRHEGGAISYTNALRYEADMRPCARPEIAVAESHTWYQ